MNGELRESIRARAHQIIRKAAHEETYKKFTGFVLFGIICISQDLV